MKTFLKENWFKILLACWCVWATLSIQEIKDYQATSSDVSQVSDDVQDIKHHVDDLENVLTGKIDSLETTIEFRH